MTQDERETLRVLRANTMANTALIHALLTHLADANDRHEIREAALLLLEEQHGGVGSNTQDVLDLARQFLDPSLRPVQKS